MRRAFILSLGLALVVLAAGCGEGTGGGGGIDNTETGTSSGADYELFASEFSFAPPFLVIEKAGTYSISLRNDGTLPHNFTIDRKSTRRTPVTL